MLLTEFNIWLKLCRQITTINYGVEFLDYQDVDYFSRLSRWKYLGLGLLHLNFLVFLCHLVGSAFVQRDSLILCLAFCKYLYAMSQMNFQDKLFIRSSDELYDYGRRCIRKLLVDSVS